MSDYQPKKNLPFNQLEVLNFPKEIQIQTQSRCNALCKICPYSRVARNLTHGILPEESFKKLIDECTNFEIKQLKVFLMNEPLIDPRLPDFIAYARKKLSAVNIGFSTNGSLLEGVMADRLLQSGIDEIWVNFSGHRQETYERIMVNLHFDRIKRNLISFSEKIRTTGSRIKLIISMVETKPVLGEIEDSRNFWKDYGISIGTVPLNNRGGNIATQELKVLRKIKSYRICDRPFFKIYILFNGDVILCSSDWKREVIIGNVLNTSIFDVWHSQCQDEIRQIILRRNLRELKLCCNCDYIAIYE